MRAAWRLTAVPLDQPVDRELCHPPPCRQLAASDGDQPAGCLVQLRLARDVDGLAGVAAGDQRPDARVCPRELIDAELGPEEIVDRLEQVVDVLRRGAEE